MRYLRSILPLWLGDAFAIFVVSVVGFWSHGEAVSPRLLTTYVPLLLAWTALAPWLGVYSLQHRRTLRSLWRIGLGAVFAAPLAAVLRGVWLNNPILPVFVSVLGATSALGMILWRALWVGLIRVRSRIGGLQDG